MQSGYIGLDLAQVIFAVAVVMVLIGLAVYLRRTLQRVQKVEQQLRDFRELEPEGFDEEDTLDTISEGARIRADEEAARQQDIVEHST